MQLQGIDHLVFVTPDLEQSRDDFLRMGFLSTPRNTHPHFGTANYLIILGNSYFELLGFDDENPSDRFGIEMFGDQIAAGGDMRAVALRTDDAAASAALHSANGLQCTPPSTWTRQANMNDGSSRPVSFTTSGLPPTVLPDAQFFYCEHGNPELVWREEWMEHPNGAGELLAVHRPLTVSADAARDRYQAVFGKATAERAGDDVAVRLGSKQVLLLARNQRETVIQVRVANQSARGVYAMQSINNVSVELL